MCHVCVLLFIRVTIYVCCKSWIKIFESFESYNAHTDPLYMESKILNLKDLFRLNCSKLVCRKNLGKLHEYHAAQIPTRSDGNVKTRQKRDIIIKPFNNNTVKINSINYKLGNAWNELPIEIKDCHYKNTHTFSKHVKAHYLSKYKRNCNIENCYICSR